ncbi:ATPase [Devosia pacifica]|uniref:histidine kinase n=1 Tax=Devosia pacifica TaxID=1335967 RepID=A0A918VW83_9HYPH|nr:ATPase [Devosia pacifica]
MIWLSGLWLVVALIATGILLTSLYSRALDTSLTETLEFHAESLAGALLATGDPLSERIRLADPRFDRPRSGWYWTVRNTDGDLYNLSTSVVGIDLPELDAPANVLGVRTDTYEDAFATEIRAVERTVSLDGERYRILVTGSLSEILELVGEFRGQTFIVLGAVGIMLAMMSGLVARFALKPIDRLSAAIEGVREGENTRVVGAFPREIAPLAEEVNELLRSNSEIIERARNQVGNLAHGLKTPIAVLRNEASASDSQIAQIVVSETDKMSTLVSTYLERARLTARTSIVGKRSDTSAVVTRLARVMAKIHPQRSVRCVADPETTPWFRGDEADLEEIVGNLLDNACKWASDTVQLEAGSASGATGAMVVLRIEDDGPGLSSEEIEQVMRRGVRLDEKTPGSGLGLDIVKELVDVYGGAITFSASRLGGLLVELTLPAARATGSVRSGPA